MSLRGLPTLFPLDKKSRRGFDEPLDEFHVWLDQMRPMIGDTVGCVGLPTADVAGAIASLFVDTW